MIVLTTVIQLYFFPMSIKQMKTNEQIFKTKVLEQVKQLTNTGQHVKASKLFNKYFQI